MSHHRQRETHRLHCYREVEVGESRRGEPRMDYTFPESEFAVAEVRTTDAGGSYTATIAGEIDTDEVIVSGPPRLLDDGVAEGQRAALEGDGFAFNEPDPTEGTWFEVKNLSRLYSRGRSVRGIELRLLEV